MSGIAPLSPIEADRTLGLSTTVPAEVILAAGLRPLDLNNIFITSGTTADLVEQAEREGFPRNSCAWNKGVYAAARRLRLKRLVGVTQGDCSNTHATMEMLQAAGVQILPFAFPYQPEDAELLALSLRRFAEALDTTVEKAEEWKRRLDAVRSLAHRIDELCWRDGLITGAEQHLFLISCSDFFGDAQEYRRRAEALIAQTRARKPMPQMIRLALIGIPPIVDGLFEFLEKRGARILFNEIPRQFSMPGATRSLIEQYSRYTYPYDIFHRLDDIQAQLKLRHVDGVIHYVQSFCFRQVQDAILRKNIDLPILTLECDRPGPMEMSTETRLEAFLEMLHGGGTNC